jgi:succinate dehydrogenase / fumarate reductase membrane anchor subunit
MRTTQKEVRGLGAAHSGTDHFWRQRITALANVPLTIFFVLGMVALTGADHAAFVAFFRFPIWAVLFLAFIIASAWHMKLGMQVIIEDYVQHEGLKIAALIGNLLFTIFFSLTCIFAVLKLSLGG